MNRECGCPEFIERCVHLDGRIAMLSGLTQHNPSCPKCRVVPCYQVVIGVLGPCTYCETDIPLIDVWEDLFYQGDDYNEALAAFAAAECELLGEAGVLS